MSADLRDSKRNGELFINSLFFVMYSIVKKNSMVLRNQSMGMERNYFLKWIVSTNHAREVKRGNVGIRPVRLKIGQYVDLN